MNFITIKILHPIKLGIFFKNRFENTVLLQLIDIIKILLLH